jgi:hypothetical protein
MILRLQRSRSAKRSIAVERDVLLAGMGALGTKSGACGDSGDLGVLAAGTKVGAFGDSGFSVAWVSEASLVASGDSGLWALSTRWFAGTKVAAVGESCAEVVEVVDESGTEIGKVDEIAMFITMTGSAAMSVVV